MTIRKLELMEILIYNDLVQMILIYKIKTYNYNRNTQKV